MNPALPMLTALGGIFVLLMLAEWASLPTRRHRPRRSH